MICYPKSYGVGIALVVFLSLLLPAQASVLNTYSDSSSFNSATSNRTLINFDGTTPTTYEEWVSGIGYVTKSYYGVYSNASGLTLNGVNFVGENGYGGFNLVATNVLDVNAAENYGSATLLKGPEWHPSAALIVTLPNNVTAFGFDFASMPPSISNFHIELVSLGASYDVMTQLRPNLTFFGATSDAAISQIRISGSSTQLLLDNFVYATAGGVSPLPGPASGGETPEITTILYVTSGIALLIWKRRRMAASF